MSSSDNSVYLRVFFMPLTSTILCTWFTDAVPTRALLLACPLESALKCFKGTFISVCSRTLFFFYHTCLSSIVYCFRGGHTLLSSCTSDSEHSFLTSFLLLIFNERQSCSSLYLMFHLHSKSTIFQATMRSSWTCQFPRSLLQFDIVLCILWT